MGKSYRNLLAGNLFKMDTPDQRANGAKYECLLFDMDDTLYPMSLGLNLACRKNIEEFMLRKLHIEESEIPKMCLELYREYGTTMAGLKVLGYEFDDDEFHAFRKIIFTNADKAHASEVLKRIGLEDCFEGIICFETLNPPLETAKNMDGLDNDAVIPGGEAEPCEFNGTAATGRKKILDNGTSSSKSRILCKPSLEAIEAAIKIANMDPKKTIFFDDSARNIASGKAAGLSYSYCRELSPRTRCGPWLEKHQQYQRSYS
ncbi:hypothetical protein OIU78_015460 [Salix suchowensis]|nr:hypothetical protein OIU78_015460 [Salix suchowensis]